MGTERNRNKRPNRSGPKFRQKLKGVEELRPSLYISHHSICNGSFTFFIFSEELVIVIGLVLGAADEGLSSDRVGEEVGRSLKGW